MGNKCMSTKDKPSKAEKAKDSKKPPQEPPTVLETKAPQKPEVQDSEAPSSLDAVNEGMKAYGIDVGQLSSAAVNTIWANCTKENLDKITQMASDADAKLKENGINVGDLTAQAATAVGHASLLLAAKMWDDAQIVIQEYWESEEVKSKATQAEKQEVIDRMTLELKDQLRASMQAGTIEEQSKMMETALSRASGK